MRLREPTVATVAIHIELGKLAFSNSPVFAYILSPQDMILLGRCLRGGFVQLGTWEC